MNSPKNLSRVHEDSSSGSSFSELCLRELSSDSSKKCSDSDCSLCIAEANKTKSRNRFSKILLNNAAINEDTTYMVERNEIENKGPKRQEEKTDPTTFTKKLKSVTKNFEYEGEYKERDAVVREMKSFRDEIHANVFENSDKSFSPQRRANTSTPKSGFSGVTKNRRAD